MWATPGVRQRKTGPPAEKQETGCKLPTAKERTANDGASRKTGVENPKNGAKNPKKSSKQQQAPQDEGGRCRKTQKNRTSRLRSRPWGSKIPISQSAFLPVRGTSVAIACFTIGGNRAVGSRPLAPQNTDPQRIQFSCWNETLRSSICLDS